MAGRICGRLHDHRHRESRLRDRRRVPEPGHPGCAGGPHVTFLAEEGLAHADLVVRGEGEPAMEALLDIWGEAEIRTTDAKYANVPNLSWVDPTGTVGIIPAGPGSPISTPAVPGFQPGGWNHRGGARSTVVVQTSRGCPFDCSFCSVTGVFWPEVPLPLGRLRPGRAPAVQQPHRFVFFCDDNFTATSAARASWCRECSTPN